MLLIHTREGQKIIIDERWELTLTSINYFNGNSSIHFNLSDGERGSSAQLKVGDSVELLQQVGFYFVKAYHAAGETVATLGFEAPREISIQGEWIGQR